MLCIRAVWSSQVLTSLDHAARVVLEEASALTGCLVPAVIEKALQDFNGAATPAVNSVAVDQAKRGEMSFHCGADAAI